jgi:hypothetical protein
MWYNTYKCFWIATILTELSLIRIVAGGVHTGSTRHVGHFWPIVPVPDDCEYGECGGIKIGRGNRSTRRKPAPAALCPPQIPLDQTRSRTRTAAVGSQRLTAWAMALRTILANTHANIYTKWNLILSKNYMEQNECLILATLSTTVTGPITSRGIGSVAEVIMV